jgi:hypothetical protein
VRMVYPVNFSIKINESFCTVQTALIFADSVSECMDKAEGVKETLPQFKKHHVHIFIDA